MFKTLSNHLRANKRELEEIKLYFEKCADDIDSSNLYMLRQACMWTAIVYICMLFLASLIVPRFRFSLGHMLLLVLIIIYFCVNMYTRKTGRSPAFNTSFLCLLYYASLSMCLMLMEINQDSMHPARWFPLFLIVFPAIYIDRQYKYGLEETFMFAVYCVVTYFKKGPAPYFKDVYTVLAAYVLSLIISRVILGVRSKQGLGMMELRRFSTMDKLTSVYNKAALIEATNQYLDRRRDGSACAMSIIDIDNFKMVNDSLGHEGGDMLLEHLGSLLIENFRPSDVIGRFGGDEFVVFMPNMKDAGLVEARCRNLQSMLNEFNIGNEEPFSLSIGTIIDEGGHNFDELFRMADDALYLSKMAGKNRCTSWVAEADQVIIKPGLVFVTSLGEEKAGLLPREEKDRFRVFVSHSDEEAIHYLSQYYDHIKLIVAEVNDENKAGELVVKYAKTRSKFSSVPVLAVVRNEEGQARAKELGADETLMTANDSEDFRKTIGVMTDKKAN